MSDKTIKREDLMQRCRSTFESYGMYDATIATYLRSVRALVIFMEESKIDSYTEEVGERYCTSLKNDFELSGGYKQAGMRAVRFVNKVLNGEPYNKGRSWHPKYDFPGDIGQEAKLFVESLREIRRNPATIREYEIILSKFCKEMSIQGKALATLRRDDVITYLDRIQAQRATTIDHIRLFLDHLYENQKIASNIGDAIRRIKKVRNAKMISYYTPDEVRKIELAIDRTSAVGKRNYAMILLASRLGLRISDIRLLVFSALDWEKNIITLQQYKTKKEIVLPLLSDVGDAIIDYVMNGRPKVESKFVFLTVVHPIRPLENCSMQKVIHDCIEKAGIYAANRHMGTHSLRQSLATSMMNNGTELPVISESLGHSSTDTTMIYLTVNIAGLLECSLPVPPVDDSYYTQKGGVFYE